jgi:hypothetical protein
VFRCEQRILTEFCLIYVAKETKTSYASRHQQISPKSHHLNSICLIALRDSFLSHFGMWSLGSCEEVLHAWHQISIVNLFLISAAGYGLLFLAIYEQIMVPSTNRTASQSIPRSGIRPREVRVQAVIEYWMSLPGKGIAPCCIASISLMVQWDKSPDRSC